MAISLADAETGDPRPALGIQSPTTNQRAEVAPVDGGHKPDDDKMDSKSL
jgi:hypothetical protein